MYDAVSVSFFVCLPLSESMPPCAASDVTPRLRSRGWVITLWNMDDVKRLESLEAPVCVVGEEQAPSTGRAHYHAYIRFANARSFRALHLQFPNCHLEPLRSTELKAVEYCKKDGKVVVERLPAGGLVSVVGDAPKKSGEVEVEVHRRLREGETIRAVWADHPIYCARNMRMLRSVVRVYELWGHRDDGATPDNLSGVEL